jgi:hypothetical protein
MIAATIRTILAQPDDDHVREQLDTIALMRGGRGHGPRAAQIDPSAPARVEGGLAESGQPAGERAPPQLRAITRRERGPGRRTDPSA